MSLQEGIVPLEWKEANIIPLFKKGSRNKSVNYRPVSLTSVICKLLETIIRDHMMDFLIKHKLINTSQLVQCLRGVLCVWRVCEVSLQIFHKGPLGKHNNQRGRLVPRQ